jgi:SAM-dependent methyltransferase
MSQVQQAVVWISPVDDVDRGRLLGAAADTASRLEMRIETTFEELAAAAPAVTAARQLGVLILPEVEPVLPILADVADLIEQARREGWRLLALDYGADSAAPSGSWLVEQLRAYSAADLADETFPVPPAAIRRRVAVGGEQTFRSTGLIHTESYAAALRKTRGQQLADNAEILDWGAGPGRMTRHLLAAAPNSRISAVDIDADAIGWLQAHLPVHHAAVTGIRPPLPLPSDAVDLLVGHSILSHLDEDDQDAWLIELARVTRPGGTVMVSINGPTALRWHVEHPLSAMPGAIAAAMPTLGFFFWRGEGWESEFHEGYHTAFHEPAYVREHWSRWFEVLDLLPAAVGGLQDIAVLTPRA